MSALDTHVEIKPMEDDFKSITSGKFPKSQHDKYFGVISCRNKNEYLEYTKRFSCR